LGLILLTDQGVRAQVNTFSSSLAQGTTNSDCKGTNIPFNFHSAGDALVFDVFPTHKGTLKVKTRDCCVPGDIWRAGVSKNGPSFIGISNAGNGNTTTYTGPIIYPTWPGKWLVVVVNYDRGVDIFPAGLEVCFEGPVDVFGPRDLDD